MFLSQTANSIADNFKDNAIHILLGPFLSHYTPKGIGVFMFSNFHTECALAVKQYEMPFPQPHKPQT